MRRSTLRLAALVMAAASAGGCAAPLTSREKGALAGGALGAGSGAIIGSTRGDAAEGALIGGAVGALGGALVGNEIEGHERQARSQEEALARQRREIAENRRLLDELRRRDLDARETARGVVVNLPDVLFRFDRADLTVEAQETVRAIAEVLTRGGRDRHVSVEGHTDAVGSEAYNQRLSEERARRVAAALVADGIGRDRISSRGFGERRPVAPNSRDGRDDPAGRARNRRVEVVIEN